MRKKWKLGMGALSLLLGCACILYCMVIRFYMGFGTWFFLIWGGIGVLFFTNAILIWGNVYEKIPKKFLRLLGFLLFIGILSFLVIQIQILRCFDCKAEAGADYVVVLGAQMKNHGPSDVLRRRLDAAAVYIKENTQTKVIVSGGKGSNEPISEAEGMYQYLVNQCGISPERIIMENQSENTRENLLFSKELMEGETPRVVIVTNNFHVFRACMLAKKLGYENVDGLAASSYPGMLPNNLMREYFGVVKDMLW